MSEQTFHCPDGHRSTDSEYCNTCGKPIQALPQGLQPLQPPGQSCVSGFEKCPTCGTERATADAPFCRLCSYDFINKKSAAQLPRRRRPRTMVAALPEVTSPPPPEDPPTALSSVPDHLADGAGADEGRSGPPTLLPSQDEFGRDDGLADSAEDAEGSLPGAAVSDESLPDAAAEALAPELPPPPVVTGRWQLVQSVEAALRGDKFISEAPVNQPERVISVDAAIMLVGRTDNRKKYYPQVTVDYDDTVSRAHALFITDAAGNLSMMDLGSSNGTEVNGIDLRPAVAQPLKDGDEITMGKFTRIKVRAIPKS